MSGISDSIEMDTREVKQNKASFSSVIPKGICAKRMGDLGHLDKEKKDAEKQNNGCIWVFTY